MPLVSPILKDIVENEVPNGVYMRNSEGDANIDIDALDLEGKTLVIYNDLTTIQNVLPEAGTFIYQNWTVQLRILRLATLDDNGDDADILRNICLTASNIIFDNLIRRVEMPLAVPLEGGEVNYEADTKLFDKIMTGITFNAVIPLVRDVYYCEPAPEPPEPPTPDPDADAIIAAMPNPLVQAEEDAITNYVSAEKASGNWDKFDSIFVGAMQDADNSLTDWIRLSQMVNDSGVHVVGVGYDLTTAHIDTLYNPAVSAVNMALDNQMIGVMVVSVGTFANVPLGITEGGVQAAYIIADGGGNKMDALMSGASVNVAQGVTAPVANTFWHGSRQNSTDNEIFEDGIQAGTAPSPSISLINTSFAIGANNIEGFGVANNFDGTISFAVMGASIGINYPAHNTNVRNLLTALGAI